MRQVPEMVNNADTNTFLLVFSISFMGCVLATPLVTRFAVWAGAIDRPDDFRRVHAEATPRMGGLAVAFGLFVSVVLAAAAGYLRHSVGLVTWVFDHWGVLVAGLIILSVGAIDDARGVKPRLKLLGQIAAVLALYAGGIKISSFVMLGTRFDLSHPSVAINLGGVHVDIAFFSLVLTLVWFLGCINIWNLLDGMDGLATGVGLLVSGTLMLIAIYEKNLGAAVLAAALAGSLAGFLLYNWHPACIFLGDSGSMLIGLLVGVIGVQYSLKKTSAVSLLFPILAMGLPISDTAMAIFRRWVRNLPLSAADRQHVHHLLMGLGLTPRQAAILLYCFSAGLCGLALLGVAFDREFLALVLGVFGCLAFLLILTSRRDELASLRTDFVARFARRRQEREAARVTWEGIQKIELCDKIEGIWKVLAETADKLGCDSLRMACYRDGRSVFLSPSQGDGDENAIDRMAGSMASFRLTSGQDLTLTIELHQSAGAHLTADIAFRFLQRLALATAERLERLLAAIEAASAELAADSDADLEGSSEPSAHSRSQEESALESQVASGWDPFAWLRLAFGSESATTGHTGSLRDD
jgi:UDP-GlcNAc:undecaprenyl-phosphate/decaprenyl-phosphate GlcNAc-1-phosphate transferase